MTLTPATLRTDLKCGKGSISKGEKCTKGAATTVDPKAPGKGKGIGTALKVAAGVALVGAAAYGAKKYGPKAIRNAKAVTIKTKRNIKSSFQKAVREQMKKEGEAEQAAKQQIGTFCICPNQINPQEGHNKIGP